MLSKDIAQRVAGVFSVVDTQKNTIVVMYSNDGYKYAYDKLTHMFYIINPINCIIFGSLNPVKTHARYEMYISSAFRKRIARRGYNQMGEKSDANT